MVKGWGEKRIGGNCVDEIKNNQVLTRVQELLINQTSKGLEKYGTTVDPESLTVSEWIDHASEEIVDFLVYLQVLKVKVKRYESEN